MGLNRNINDDSTLAYLFNKTRQGASDALQKAIDAINATIASIQTALNDKASKNGSDITNASTWRSNIGAVNKAGDTMTGDLTVSKSGPVTFLKDTVADTSTNPSSDISWTFGHRDKNNKYASYWQTVFKTTGVVQAVFGARRIVSGTSKSNTLSLNVADDGTNSVSVASPAAWRTALGLGGMATVASPAPIANGGTGLTASPSMLVKLDSTTAANVLAASPRPGVTGTLAVGNGGTGLTASPSMLTNLGTTTAANVLAASPRPGITGTLAIAHGGTGKTTAADARTNLGLGGMATVASPAPIANGGTGQTAVTKTTTASSIFTASSGVTIVDAAFAQWGKMATVRLTLKKNAAISANTQLGTMVSGKRPAIDAMAWVATITDHTAYITTDGKVYINTNFSANLQFVLSSTFMLA